MLDNDKKNCLSENINIKEKQFERDRGRDREKGIKRLQQSHPSYIEKKKCKKKLKKNVSTTQLLNECTIHTKRCGFHHNLVLL